MLLVIFSFECFFFSLLREVGDTFEVSDDACTIFYIGATTGFAMVQSLRTNGVAIIANGASGVGGEVRYTFFRTESQEVICLFLIW